MVATPDLRCEVPVNEALPGRHTFRRGGLQQRGRSGDSAGAGNATEERERDGTSAVHVMEAIMIAKVSKCGWAGVLWLATLSGCAADATPEEEGDSSSLILGGTTDTADRAVVAILASDAKGAAQLCTGEVIAPRVVLTAGHCVVSGDIGPIIKFEVRAAADIHKGKFAPADVLAVDHVVRHPGFVLSTLKNDIAAVILASPTSIKPLALNRSAAALKAGASARILGYGMTSNDDTASVGVKHTGATRIANISATHFEVISPATQCHGDSGGPTLVKIAGKETIVGISSGTVSHTASCALGGTDTRVDAYLGFIDAILKANAGTATPKPAPTPTPGGAGDDCTTAISCTDGKCTCTAGPNVGRACNGASSSGASSCSAVCSFCP